MARVIIFGSMNMDLSIECDRMPQAGETLSGHDFITNPGGKGANQAVAASRLGASVGMIAAVGADGFGNELVATLEAVGVDCTKVTRSSETSTGVAIIVRSAGDNRIVLSAGANHLLSSEDVVRALHAVAEPGDVFLTQGECDAEATLAGLHEAHSMGLYTILNPAPARPMPDEAWADVDLVCLNETECELMCGICPTDEEGCLKAASRLQELGVRSVVITLGSEGSIGFEAAGDKPVRAVARKVEVVDTTAAGDTYIGALAAGHAAGMSLVESMAWGSAASALTVGKLGAQQAIPTAAEVKATGWKSCS